jgi:hypothetical protein
MDRKELLGSLVDLALTGQYSDANDVFDDLMSQSALQAIHDVTPEVASQYFATEEEDPCWDGYQKKGLKKKGKKMVPNCVPEDFDAMFDAMTEHLDLTEEELAELSKATLGSYAKKAAVSRNQNSSKGDTYMDQAARTDNHKDAGAPERATSLRAKGQKHYDKQNKRTKGINTALTKS